MALDFASGIAGAMGGVSGLYNAHELAKPNYYAPQYATQSDQAWYTAMQAIQAATNRNTGLVDPVLLQSFSQMLGIDLAPLAAAGVAAGKQYGNLAEQAGFYGSQMGDVGTGIVNASLDPQQALYDRTKQRVVEGSRAADSARGIAMSPYSAGLENQAVRDFNIDWENQQLARRLAGAQGAGGAYSSSTGFYGMAPQASMASAYAPIQAQQTQYQLPIDWASAFTQAQGQNVQGPQQAVASGFGNYIFPATGVQSQQYQQNFNRNLAQNAMQQQSYYGLAGGGQSQGGNPYGQWGGNQSGFGDPMNWWGMGNFFGG